MQLLVYAIAALLAAAAMTGLHVITDLRYQSRYDEVAHGLIADAQKNAQAKVQKVEEIFRQAYQNILTISVLPSIREIDRHGTKISPLDRETIARLYESVNARMKISEIYVVPESFNPAAEDPGTGQKEVPAIMFDSSITGAATAGSGTASVAASAPTGEPQVEDEEYQLLTEQIAALRKTYPTTASFKGGNPPMIAGHEVITCDNTDFDQTHVDADRKGIVISIPYYNRHGQFAGVVATIIRTKILQAIVGDTGMKLVSEPYGYEIKGVDPTKDAAQPAHDAAAKTFPALAVKTDDANADWQLIAAMPNVAAAADAAASETRRSEWFGQLGILALAALLLSGAIYLRKRYIEPTQRLTEAMVEIAAGNLDTQVPQVRGSNIVGRVHNAVLAFQNSMRSLHTVEQSREHVISALANGLEQVKSGDLTHGINDPFPQEMERLREAFNDAVHRLQGVIRTVKSGADVIKHGSSEIAQASTELSRRTENQAESLAETVTAMSAIAATVKQTAQGAAHARTVVNQAREDASHCEDVAKRTIAAMGGIEKSSQQITQIIGVIDEIAFQTNLLALNAGVEAARAGDVGRGFAVVASEVRALALRSAEAARQIKDLIASASDQVSQGVVLVSNTGEALQRIIARVQQINGIVNEIAASSEGQSASLEEVSAAVDRMDQMTSQNAAMAEESTAATQTLLQNSNELNVIVGGFQTSAA